jgi:ABC-2 type transport system ATP-binding protein
MLIELQGINKFYDTVHALSDIDLSVEQGSIGLLGPNGAGKTTLLKILLGLALPSSGSVQVMGFDATARALDLRQRVGYMPELDCYISGLDAVELCAYAAELCGLPRTSAKERAHAVLAYVGLEDKRYQKVNTYSTGQKQRVKLAQALVHDPELLLLDEPTNGLDPHGREEMLTLIRELPAKRGCSIILSSHLLPDVEAVCERAIMLNEGRLIYSGAIADMRGQQRDTYKVQVKESPQRLLHSLQEVGCTVDTQDNFLVVQLPQGSEPDLIFSTALKIEVQIRHLKPMRQSLEAAFVRLVQRAEKA